MQEKMKEYQNALDDMSNEAVEYVRGIPVVKTFGQTIFSFKKFKDSIDRYKVWAVSYTHLDVYKRQASPSYKSIKNLLVTGLEKLASEAIDTKTTHKAHGITRGADYYRR